MQLPETIGIPDLTQLLSIAVWGGLCAGVLAIWRAPWLRTIVVVQAVVIGLLTAVLSVWTTGFAYTATVMWGRWLTVRDHSAAAVSIKQVFDRPVFVFLLAVSVVVAVLATRRDSRASSPHDFRRGLFWFLSYQAALQFVLSADLVLQLACWQLLSMAILLGVVGDPSVMPDARTTARRTFLFRLTADAVILIALVIGVNHAAFGLLLFFGVMGRCCPFPFLSRDRFAGIPRDVMLMDRLIVSPLSLLLLIRCNVLVVLPESLRVVMVLGSAALAFTAALTAMLRTDGQQRIAVVSLSLTALMLAGAMSGVAEGIGAAVAMFLAHAVLLTVAESAGTSSSKTSTAAGILLGCGAVGQGLLLSALLQVAEQKQQMLWWTALLLCGIAHLSTAFAIGHWLRNRLAATASGSVEEERRSVIGKTLPGLLVSGLVSLVAWQCWQTEAMMSDLFAFLLAVLSGLIGMTGGWIVARPVATDSPSRITALVGDGWRLDRLFLRFCIAPLLFLAALCRFAEWFIIEGLWSAPALLPRFLQRVEVSLQTHSLRRSVCAVLLAAVLLCAVIAVGN